MQKSPFRRLISFESLSQYVSDTLSENASSSVSPLISRTMAVETLESRVLLSASPTLITDPIALMADSSTSITDFERVYHPTGSAAVLYPDNQTSTAFIFPAGKSVQSYTLTLGTGVSTTSYSMNISVVLGKDNLSSGNFTAKLYDSSKVLVSDGLINSTDGTISFSGIANTGGTSYTLQISRTENTAEQISYGIKAYQSVLGTVADVAVQSGTFAQSTGQTTNSYTFSLAKNTAGSVCVYAPESQNVTVVLYQGSTKIAQAVNSSDGYYTIPAFYNSNTSSGTTEYTVKVTGGSNLQTEAYTLTVSKNGVYNAQSDNSTETATDLGKVGSVIAGSVSGTSQTLERTAIDAGLSYSTGFGSVIAYDSNRLYVSTPKQTTNSSILFYSPDLTSDSWTQTQSWSKPSECASDGLFGCSLSASDNWLAAGASNDTVNGVKTGSVYLYNQTTKNVQRITPADGTAGDCFGASVVVKGEWLFVGSTSAEGGQANSGAVYVYHLNSQTGVWDYSQKIVSETNVSIAKFGFALDCDGTTLAVSAPFDSTDGILDADGAVYTYQLRGSQWTLTQTISLASLTSVPGGSVLNLNDMQFGYSLKLNNGKLVIGCPGFKNGNVKGIAGVFEQNDTGDWINTSTLYQSSQFVSEFGTSVDISGNKIIVSAAGQSCSVYVFQTSSASNQSWELASTISSTGVDNFGQSVLIAGDKVIVSSPSSESGVTSSQLLQSYSSLGTANYYLLNITSRTGADATFRFAPTNGLTLNDVDVFLTDAQGNRLDSLLTLTNSYGGIYTTGSIELGTNASGAYYLCVQPHSGCSGDYSVSVSYAAKGEFNADLQNPQESARITQMPSKLIFKFSDVFNCSSLTTATLVVNTGVKSVTLNSSNCTIIDGKTISVSTSAFSSLTGQISFSFAGITDLWGNTISSDSNTLYVDTTAPGLTGSSYIDFDGTKVYYSGSSASIKQSSSTVISLTFDDDINLPESAAAIKRWISITGSNGNSIDFDTAVNTSTHTVVLTISTTLSDDAYTIELSDNFVDMAGNKLNSASSSWTFFVNSTESISMPNVTSGMTDGSLLYTSSISGNISQSGETDKFTIRIDADNMYSVYVVPNSSSALKPTVTVVSGSSTIGTATATSTGTTAALEGKLVSGDTYKEYTIQVTGASNSTGGYTVYVVLNGVLNTPTSSSTVKTLYTGTSSWFSPAFANTNTTKSYIVNVLGNTLSGTPSSDQIYKLVVSSKDYMSIVLNPGTNSGAKVGVYSLGNCQASSQIAEGYINENGLLVIDPLFNTTTSLGTYYIKVSGVTSQYQLTAIRNGVLDLALDSSDITSSSVYKTVAGTTQGLVYVYGHTSYISNTLTDSQMQILEQSGQVTGTSVSISGDWAVIGSQTSSSQYGSVKIYQKVNDTWVLHTNLTGSSINALGFGCSVSISGNYLAVGAENGSKDGSIYSGAVFVYEYNGTSWNQISVVYPENRTTKDGVMFGTHVHIDGNWLAVGATQDIYNGSVCGSVYMYKLDSSSVTFTQQLLAGADSHVLERDASVCEYFGYSIDIDNNWMVIGSPSDFIYNTGAAYVFYYDGIHWVQSGIISSTSLLNYGDKFGTQVAIEDNFVIVSAPEHKSNTGTGSVFVYKISDFGTTPNFVYQLQPSVEGTANFGLSMDFSNNQILVSGYTDSTLTQSKTWIYLLDSAGTPYLSSTTDATAGKTVVCAANSNILFSRPESGTILASDSLSQIDTFTFTTDASGTITASLIIPSNNSVGDFVNNLGGVVSYYSADGTQFYSDSQFTSGTYSAVIKSYAGRSGEYIYYLSYPRTTLPSASTFEITGFANGINNRVQSSTSTIDIQFNTAVDISTLTTAIQKEKIKINGVAVTSYTAVDGKTIRLTVPSGGASSSQYVLTVQSGAIANLAGQTIGESALTLTIDSTPVIPTMYNTTAKSGFQVLTVNLSEELLNAPSLSEVTLTGAKTGAVELESIVYDAQTKKLLIRAASLPDDYYTLTLITSNGAYADLAGNWLDGNSSQSGIQNYILNFSADWSEAQTIDYTSSNYTLMELGNAWIASADGYLTAGDTDTINLNNIPINETASIFVETTNGVKPTVLVYKGSISEENLVETDTIGQNNSGAWLFGFTSSTKTNYIVVLKNETTSEGSYTLTATVNGHQEIEQIGLSNNSIENAESITGLFYDNDAVTVQGNLSSATDVDWYKFNLSKGNWANIYLIKNDNADISLSLYANGTQIAAGVKTDDFSQMITNLVETSNSGSDYFIKISGNAGDYQLLVATDTVYNQDSQSASVVHNNSWVIGTLDKSSGYENTFVQTDIVSSDSLGRGSFFGSSVSVDGNWMVVGGRFANQSGISSGYAAIYRSSSTGWTLFKELTPSQVNGNDQLGYAVSVKGNVALVSAPIQQLDGCVGSVYVYEYENGTWNLKSTVNQFGSDVVFGLDVQVISDTRIAVGSSSQAAIYTKNSAGKWVLESGSTISQNDVITPENYSIQGFGSSIGVNSKDNSNIMVIGAANTSFYNSGSGWLDNIGLAFIYQYNSSTQTWTAAETLELSDSSNIELSADAGFGSDVLVYGNYVCVSAPRASSYGMTENGAVYIYELRNGAWYLDTTLTGGQDGELFGSSIALDGNCLVVGSMYYSFTTTSGSLLYTGKVTAFEQNAYGNWITQQSVLSGDTTMGAFVGSAVDLNNGVLAIGAVGQRPENAIDSPRSGVVFTYASANTDDEYTFNIDATKKIDLTINKVSSPLSALTSIEVYYRKAGSTTETKATLTAITNGWTASISSSLGSGDYIFRIVNTGTVSGQYAMKITNSGIDTTGTLAVSSISPASDARLDYKTDTISVTFNKKIRPDLIAKTLNSVELTCGGTTIDVQSVKLDSDGKTVLISLNGSYPYKNDTIKLTLNKDNFVTLDGAMMTSNYVLNYTIPLETVATTSEVIITDSLLTINIQFDENVSPSSNALWKEVTSFKVYYPSTQSYVTWIPQDLHFAYDSTNHILTVTSSDVITENCEYQLILDGDKVFGDDSGEPLSGLINNQYVIPFINSSNSITISGVVNKSANTTIDSNGETAALAPEQWIDEWQSFYLELWAQSDLDSVGQINLEINYSSDMFIPATSDSGGYIFEAATAFTGSNGSFSIKQLNGKIIVSAETTVEDLGSSDYGKNVFLGRIKFVPSESGAGVPITVYQTGEAYTTGITLSSYSLGRTQDGTAINQKTAQTTTEVWPVIYDLDDSNAVNMQDFIQFATNFNTTADITKTSWYTDFDSSGTTNMQDFIQFATNFNANRKSGSTISYPADFITKIKDRIDKALNPVSAAALPVQTESIQTESIQAVTVDTTQTIQTTVTESQSETPVSTAAATVSVVQQIQPVVTISNPAITATVTLERTVSIATQTDVKQTVTEQTETEQTSITTPTASILLDDSWQDWDSSSLGDSQPVSQTPLEVVLDELLEEEYIG